MKTCPYCGSNVDQMNSMHYYCDFCDMTLPSKCVKENRERLDVRVRDFAAYHSIYKTTPELMVYSTFELFYLLKLIRKERTDMYHHMHVFHQACELEDTNDFREAEKETGSDYIYLTKKSFVVENIIRQRLGYVPARITETYLVKYLENIKNDKTSPMMIRTERQKKRNKKGY